MECYYCWRGMVEKCTCDDRREKQRQNPARMQYAASKEWSDPASKTWQWIMLLLGTVSAACFVLALAIDLLIIG